MLVTQGSKVEIYYSMNLQENKQKYIVWRKKCAEVKNV